MSYIIKKTTEIIINSMQDIDNYLKTQDTENCNIVNYAWLEYGFYPIFFNELFKLIDHFSYQVP